MIRRRKFVPQPYVIAGLERNFKIATPNILYDEGIIQEIGRIYNTDLFEEVKNKRNRARLYVRYVFFYFMKESFGIKASLKWLGDIFEQDHTTVISALKTFKDMLDTDAILPSQVITLHNENGTIQDYSFTKNQIKLWMEEKQLTL